MNDICKTCPRYTPGYTYTNGETWNTSHRCPGTTNPVFTGCARRPYNPLASVLGIVYNIDTESWEYQKKPAPLQASQSR